VSIWSKGTGRNQIMTRGNSAPTTVLSETFTDPETHEARASVYTLQFSFQPIGNANGASPPPTQNPTVCYATITWMIDGNQIQRMVSVANGQSIAGCASACTVSLSDDTDVLAGGDPVPQYNVTVTLTPGSRGSNQIGPTWFPNDYEQLPSGFQNTGGGASGVLQSTAGGDFEVNIVFPEGSGLTSVQVTLGTLDGSAVNAVIRQVSHSGANVKVYDDANYYSFVPLDPRTRGIKITNLSSSTQCYWGICFGVDG